MEPAAKPHHVVRWLRHVAAHLRRPRTAAIGRRLLSAAVVGVGAGCGAVLFYWLLQAGLAYGLGLLAHYVPPEAGGEPSPFGSLLEGIDGEPRRWLLVLLPMLGGLLSGLVVFRFAPEAEGHGTDSAIAAFHHRGGSIRSRVPFVKAISAAVCIGSGGSGGREGPIAQIGAGIGSFLADRLAMPERERRLLMLAGMGAGVGAIFKAPLAGALFAGEVLYREQELEYEALLPATVASIISYSIFCSVFGWQPLFVTPSVVFERPLELFGYGLLGLVCAGGGWLYVRGFYGVHRVFHHLRWPRWLKPTVGGLLCGLCGWLIPGALATGYGQIQRCLDGDATLTIGFLLALALAKIAATAFSIGSGGSGGVFGPAMVIGGSLGYATGLVCQSLGLVGDPRAMVLVGMAGFFAGAANTPLSTIIMVSEMTGNYRLLVPCMWTCSISYVLLRRASLYRSQLANRQSSPAHTGELAVDILQALRVDEWMNRGDTTIRDDLPLEPLRVAMADGGHTRYPVVDAGGRITGVIDCRDLLSVVRADEASTLSAGDLRDPHFTTITGERSLHDALLLLDHEPHGMLLVVDADEPDRLRGVLRRQDVLHAYHHAAERTLRSVHRAESGAVHLPADLTVGEAMTVEVDSVPPDWSLAQLEQWFHETGHHGAPVVDEGQLVGVVSLSDLERGRRTGRATVAGIATRRPVTCFPYETLVEALRKFGASGVGRLPVVDPADPTRLVGLLRRSDVVNSFAAAAAHEREDEELAVLHALDVPRSRFIEFTLGGETPAAGAAVRELVLPTDCLLVSIRRGADLLMPHGETRLEPGDRVTVLCAVSAQPAVQAVLGRRQG